MSCVNVHVIESTNAPTLAPTDVGQHWINTSTGAMWQSNGTATVANWVKVDADTDVKVKVSANDTTPGFLNGKLVAGGGIVFVENNDGANETLTISSTSSLLGAMLFRYSGHFLNELRHNLADASAGVPVTISPAPLVADVTYTSILVLGFDDSVSEGVKFGATIPLGATSVNFRYTSKPRTIPAGAVAVNTALYTRRFADNTAPGAWSAANNLGTLAFAANLNMRLHTQTVTLATLGVVAGEFVDFELIRRGADASDTLVGDWQLAEFGVFFT